MHRKTRDIKYNSIYDKLFTFFVFLDNNIYRSNNFNNIFGKRDDVSSGMHTIRTILQNTYTVNHFWQKMSDCQRRMSLVLNVFLSTNIDGEKINVSNNNRENETNLRRIVVGEN